MTAPQTTDEDGLVGIHPDADLTVSDERKERGLLYASKSRVKTWTQCPRKFFYKYWVEQRPPENYYMVRGSQVHEVFEDFHGALAEHVREHGERPSRFTDLLEDWRDYAQWVEMVGTFFAFEERRWQEAMQNVINAWRFPQSNHEAKVVTMRTLERWEPLGVEVEGWLGEPPEEYERADPDHVNPDGPPVGDIPWMGKADAILPTASVPGVEGDGVVILDYKTGSVPDERYRDEGIFLEGEFYGWLFEEFYDVDGVAGYYPSADELITAPYPSKTRRFDIKRAILAMQQEPDIENFEPDAQPLCHYGHGKCFFFDQCESTWGE